MWGLLLRLCVLSLAANAFAQPDLDRSPLAKLAPGTRTAVEDALRSKNYRVAEQLLADRLAAEPDSGLYGFLGSLLFLHGEYLNAGIALKKADVLVPLPPEQRFTLAMCYVLLKTSGKAREELDRLALQFPRNGKYIYWLGRLDYDAQQFPAALFKFQQAVKLDPKNARAYDNIGLSYEAMGRNEEAIQSYTQAMKLNKPLPVCSPWPAHNLSSLLRKLGRFEEAWDSAQEALRCDSNFARGHLNLGLLLEKKTLLPEAIASVRRARSMEPSYAEAHYVLGRLLQRAGEIAEAQTEFEIFQKLKSTQPTN